MGISTREDLVINSWPSRPSRLTTEYSRSAGLRARLGEHTLGARRGSCIARADRPPRGAPMLKTLLVGTLLCTASAAGAQTATYRRLNGNFLNDLSVTPGKMNAQADATKICVPG